MNRAFSAKALLVLALGSGAALAQMDSSPTLRVRTPAYVPASTLQPPPAPVETAVAAPAVPAERAPGAAPAPIAAPAPTAAPSTAVQPPATITIPEGTRILLTLRSPLHTTSAEDGAGVFAEVASPVIGEGRVLIPLKAQVQGVIESAKRPGRVKGRAQLLLHFNTLIFPNNYVVSMDGALQGVPGSKQLRSRRARGAIEPVDQINGDFRKVFMPSLAGAALGSISSFGVGTLIGAGAGAAFGVGHSLITRGDDIRLMPGTTLEMVLERPLTLEAGRLP